MYLQSINKRECTTLYRPDNKKQTQIENEIYDEGVLNEFYNIIRINYLRKIQDCIDNDMGTRCDTPNISIEDWSNIQYYIENNSDIKGGFEKEIMDAYRHRLDKCLNNPTVTCGEEEMNRIKENLPSKDVLNAFRYRYASCLIDSSGIICPEDELSYLETYIDGN